MSRRTSLSCVHIAAMHTRPCRTASRFCMAASMVAVAFRRIQLRETTPIAENPCSSLVARGRLYFTGAWVAHASGGGHGAQAWLREQQNSACVPPARDHSGRHVERQVHRRESAPIGACTPTSLVTSWRWCWRPRASRRASVVTACVSEALKQEGLAFGRQTVARRVGVLRWGKPAQRGRG